ncbi:OmpA/MotB domain-containing protein [Chryseotalea sanaruensis]|uniref:OmpA/MotB domain-containing protein n=1 Tax=Chryseotalea sanaruensis TaxID=2482724 RepID=A0A401U4Q7_9BACT|nr:OmpA family protein [Chryseotalea sanaruensis]GCC49862.1 OmpA/MotB domain-containing protein [Chryseotalea sanaruensis]
MKNNYCTLLVVLVIYLFQGGAAMAQGGSIGFHATIAEYDGDLNGNVHQYYKFENPKLGGALSLQQYLNPSFNLVEKLSYNTLGYKNSDRTLGIDAYMFALNLKLRYKFNNGYIFKEDATIAPFITGGIGVTLLNSKQDTQTSNAVITDNVYAANIAAGAGIFFRFNDRVGLEVANTVNSPMYDNWDGVDAGKDDLYLQYSAGLIFKLQKPSDQDNDGVADKKDKCPDTPSNASVDSAGCPIDIDQDGIPDYLDACPNQIGLPVHSGCPDTDGDGVEDKNDRCPDVSGLSRFSGCPDSDGDGIEDAEDLCPNLKGLDIFKGCPDTDGDGVEDSIDKCADTPAGAPVDATGCIIDTDGDGINDVEDDCPKIAGTKANKGCPELKPEVQQLFQKALQGIQFESGRAVIKKISYPIMDAISKVMVDNPSYKLVIGGHTDNVGSEESNMTLSKMRADAVSNYLITKEIDPLRLSSFGFGESTPVDTNETTAGRMRNRRVEFKVEYLK